VETIIQTVSLFFFVQFLAVVAIMSLALFLTKPEVLLEDREPLGNNMNQHLAFILHAPNRILQAAARLKRLMHLRSVH
jgi:hypothetical protein